MATKKAEDYYDKVHERFPDLSMNDIIKIVQHGMRSFYYMNACGADVLLKNSKLTLFFGRIFKDKVVSYKYHIMKKRLKMRLT